MRAAAAASTVESRGVTADAARIARVKKKIASPHAPRTSAATKLARKYTEPSGRKNEAWVRTAHNPPQRPAATHPRPRRRGRSSRHVDELLACATAAPNGARNAAAPQRADSQAAGRCEGKDSVLKPALTRYRVFRSVGRPAWPPWRRRERRSRRSCSRPRTTPESRPAEPPAERRTRARDRRGTCLPRRRARTH